MFCWLLVFLWTSQGSQADHTLILRNLPCSRKISSLWWEWNTFNLYIGEIYGKWVLPWSHLNCLAVWPWPLATLVYPSVSVGWNNASPVCHGQVASTAHQLWGLCLCPYQDKTAKNCPCRCYSPSPLFSSWNEAQLPAGGELCWGQAARNCPHCSHICTTGGWGRGSSMDATSSWLSPGATLHCLEAAPTLHPGGG